MLGMIGVILMMGGALWMMYTALTGSISNISNRVKNKDEYIRVNKVFSLILGATVLILSAVKIIEMKNLAPQGVDIDMVILGVGIIIVLEVAEYFRRLRLCYK